MTFRFSVRFQIPQLSEKRRQRRDMSSPKPYTKRNSRMTVSPRNSLEPKHPPKPHSQPISFSKLKNTWTGLPAGQRKMRTMPGNSGPPARALGRHSKRRGKHQFHLAPPGDRVRSLLVEQEKARLTRRRNSNPRKPQPPGGDPGSQQNTGGCRGHVLPRRRNADRFVQLEKPLNPRGLRP
jgi:hypothetical protein